jgi:peptide/nickel transport system permease protein
VELEAAVAGEERVGRARRRVRSAVSLGLPLALLCLLVLAAVVGAFVTPRDPQAFNPLSADLPPGSGGFLLGTDSFGRDLLSRALAGAHLSLLIGVIPVVVAGIVGFALGALAGLGPKWLGFVIMRLTDIAFAFPAIMLALAVAAVLGPSVRNAVLALTIVLVPPVSRIARAAALDIAGRPYLLAARLSGASPLRIMWDFAVPNMAPAVIVYCAALCSLTIIFGAGLSFIGVGVQAPAAEWGRMVADGRQELLINPWTSLVPGACIFLVSLAFNLLADRLRDRLDPGLR